MTPVKPLMSVCDDVVDESRAQSLISQKPRLLLRQGSVRINNIFKRGSLQRRMSGSLQSTSTVLSTTSTSTDSDGDEIISVLNSFTIKSVLKHEQSSKLTIKTVDFRKGKLLRKVQVVESYRQYAKDLWWSLEDIEKSKSEQFDLTKASVNDLAKVKAYFRGISEAQRQLREPLLGPQERRKNQIASDCYRQIIAGRAIGLGGLEMYLMAGNRQEVQYIVSSIVQKFKDSDNESSYVYAKSLTNFYRTWAIILGHADRDAYCVE
jgi:hypothetical protein